MPPQIRALLSVLVAIVSALLWSFRVEIGLHASALLFFGLSAGLIGALWMFPEVKKGEKSG